MHWQEIKDVTPNFPKEVLLGLFTEHQVGYALGTLGGAQNSPKVVMYRNDGSEYELIATHWAELTPPRPEDMNWA